MKNITIIGNRPDNAPRGWLIHNAPRPLYGHISWQGDFLHGVFYATINPVDKYAPGWLELNEQLDAYELDYISRDEAVKVAYQYYQNNYPKIVSKIDLNNAGTVNMMLTGWLRSINK